MTDLRSRSASRALSFSLALMSLFLNPPLLQSQTSTSAILQGNVLDANGSGMPRAHVELMHVPTGTTYRVAADAEGHYLFAAVGIGGPYNLSISHIGFKTQVRKGIFLRSYQNARIDVVLQQVNLLEEEVLVRGMPEGILQNQPAGPSLRVDRGQLEAFPQATGSLEDAQRLSPYMVGYSALGFNRVYSDLSMDGIGIGDQFGLQHSETMPGGMQASPVTMESIQEVRVDLSPFDVQRSGFTGAAISALSRQGSNMLTGSLYGNGAGGRYVGRNPESGRSDFREFTDDRAGLRIGGPLIRAKAFYFVAAEFSQVRVPIERQFGAPVSGGTVFSFSPDAITQLQTVLDTAYRYRPGRMDMVSLQRRSANIFGRFDLDLSRGQRFTVRYNLLATESDRPPYEKSVFAGGSLARNANTVHSLIASLNNVIGSSMANELLVGYTRRQLTSTPLYTPFPFVDVLEVDKLRWWNHLTVGNEIGGNGNHATEDHLELRNSTSLTLGPHLLTGGVQGDLHWFSSSLLSDQWGRYTFASRSALARKQPSEYEYRYARIPGADIETHWRALQFGVYLQDEVALSRIFTVSAGLRADVPVFPDRPKDNTLARDAFLAFGYDISTTRVPAPRLMLSPRIGFTVKPRRDDSVQVRGGIGVFTGRIPYAWIDNLYSHTGLDYVHIKESTSPPKFVANPWAQPVPDTSNNLKETMEIVALSKDFVLPQELRGSLAIDLAFPGNILVTIEAVISRTIKGVAFRNINLFAADTINYRNYYSLDFPNTQVERVLFGKNDARFTNAMLMSNVKGGTTDFYTIQVQRRPENGGLYASVAYSWGTNMDFNSGAWDNAYDQWRYNPALHPNEPLIGFSSFDRRNRISAALSYKYEWSPGFPTTIGIVYTGLSGTPFSYVYDGDVNGDGETLNDLFYIPGHYSEVLLCDSEGEFVGFTGYAYQELFKFITQDEYLSQHRGRLAERNGARTPWVHQLDLRLGQCMTMVGTQQLDISLEVLNILNLLKSSWGLVQTVPNGVVPVLRADAAGQRMFQWAPRTSPFTPEPLLSRWRLRLGVRYSF
jgi:hypothetical protein